MIISFIQFLIFVVAIFYICTLFYRAGRNVGYNDGWHDSYTKWSKYSEDEISETKQKCQFDLFCLKNGLEEALDDTREASNKIISLESLLTSLINQHKNICEDHNDSSKDRG